MTQFSDNLQFLTVIMLLRKALKLELEQGFCAPSTRSEISLSKPQLIYNVKFI
jgi:hypothetical protein